MQRLDAAIEAMRENLNRLIEQGDILGTGEHRDVLEAMRMVANDRGWLRRLREAIATGLTAEAAVERVPERRPRQAAAPDRPVICATGCTIWTISPTGCCTN